MQKLQLIIHTVLLCVCQLSGQNFSRMVGIGYSDITIQDSFWSPKIRDVATNALDVCIYQTEEVTNRIRNFENVAANDGSRHRGIYFDDSDVYKAIEAMAYSLHSVPNPEIEQKADEWIDKIAAAQQSDGYLNTYYTLRNLDERWTDMERHEAYCGGHLIEAAIAYYHATGKKKLLDVAIRFADHMNEYLRKGNRPWVAGHQEIELALIKLYRVTDNEEYLELSQWFLDQRGHGHGKGKIWDDWEDPAYCQDSIPIKEQREITGHAVRAMYMYTGVADLAAIINDEEYMKTMHAVWEDVVHRNTYVTGGIGSTQKNEGFDSDYDLPNEEAYCETCASVGMVFWNQRMNWLTGHSDYIDVLERSLYNSALDGIALDGKQFFYPNPLKSHGQHERKDWFGTACCPSNISRLITSVGNYIYGKSKDALYINLFIGNEMETSVGGEKVSVKLETQYPWSGQIKCIIETQALTDFALKIRIPGWVQGEVLPGGLYKFVDPPIEKPILKVDGQEVEINMEEGYAVIKREWNGEHVVELDLPLAVRLIQAKQEVRENQHRHALQYGPLVYCFEEADNQEIFNLLLPADVDFDVIPGQVLDERVMLLQGELPSLQPDPEGAQVVFERKSVTAIPYYTWCNRGSNDMQVWMPSRITGIEIP